MRMFAAALVAMAAFPNSPVRAAEDWFQYGIDIKQQCRYYAMKQDVSGRFRNYLSKSEGSTCSYPGRVFVYMADCEGFRYRTYVQDQKLWTEWYADIPPGSIAQSEIKYICN